MRRFASTFTAALRQICPSVRRKVFVEFAMTSRRLNNSTRCGVVIWLNPTSSTTTTTVCDKSLHFLLCAVVISIIIIISAKRRAAAADVRNRLNHKHSNPIASVTMLYCHRTVCSLSLTHLRYGQTVRDIRIVISIDCI